MGLGCARGRGLNGMARPDQSTVERPGLLSARGIFPADCASFQGSGQPASRRAAAESALPVEHCEVGRGASSCCTALRQRPSQIRCPLLGTRSIILTLWVNKMQVAEGGGGRTLAGQAAGPTNHELRKADVAGHRTLRTIRTRSSSWSPPRENCSTSSRMDSTICGAGRFCRRRTASRRRSRPYSS